MARLTTLKRIQPVLWSSAIALILAVLLSTVMLAIYQVPVAADVGFPNSAGTGIPEPQCGELNLDSSALWVAHPNSAFPDCWLSGQDLAASPALDRWLDEIGDIATGPLGSHVEILVGSPNNNFRSYLRLDVESGAPPAGDCNEASEIGRLALDGSNQLLYVCFSGGWTQLAI